tara:strand:- start:2068 stop:2220 length:153 start_codon:yes stop_codon:yes gene_type:complete
MDVGDLFWAILALQCAALLGLGGIYTRIGILTGTQKDHARRLSIIERKLT